MFAIHKYSEKLKKVSPQTRCIGRSLKPVATIDFSLTEFIRPGVNFTNFLPAFTFADPKKMQKDSQVKQLFCAFGICVRKSRL